jgi:hypothetical protein
MDLSSRVLGTTTAHRLEERATAVLLRIGRDEFHRGDLASVACFNFLAAANLSAVLNRELQVRDAKDVFDHVSPSALALPRLGAVAIAVLGACFEVRGLGGDHPLEAWVRKHTERHTDNEIRTFDTLKHQIRRREPAPRRRVARFTHHARRRRKAS